MENMLTGMAAKKAQNFFRGGGEGGGWRMRYRF